MNHPLTIYGKLKIIDATTVKRHVELLRTMINIIVIQYWRQEIKMKLRLFSLIVRSITKQSIKPC